jgi:hypothetical protein
VQLDDRLPVGQDLRIGAADLVHCGPQAIQHHAMIVRVFVCRRKRKEAVPQGSQRSETDWVADFLVGRCGVTAPHGGRPG